MSTISDKELRNEILLGVRYGIKYRNLSYDKLGKRFCVTRHTVSRVGMGFESALIATDKQSLLRALLIRRARYEEMMHRFSLKTLAKRHKRGYRSLKRISGLKVRTPNPVPKRAEPPTSSPIARFLAMQLSRNPGVVAGYY